MTNNKKRLCEKLPPYRILTACILFLSLILVSCRDGGSRDKGIRIVVEETQTEEGTVIQIPSFVSDNEQIQRNLRDLEKQTKFLQKTAEREQKRGNRLEMKCHITDVKHYPQVTVVWSTEERGADSCNIMTLAADEKEGLSITCREALMMTQMSGVDLSLKVGRLVKEECLKENLRGELSSTEMQGFLLNEKGEVSEIYMKVVLEAEENEEKIKNEHFFSYNFKEEKLVNLSSKGFDVP